jgi:hypothetical protein
MWPGRHTEHRVAQVVHAGSEVSRAARLRFDGFYSFFARSARKVNDSARHPAVTAAPRLKVRARKGLRRLVIDSSKIGFSLPENQNRLGNPHIPTVRTITRHDRDATAILP